MVGDEGARGDVAKPAARSQPTAREKCRSGTALMYGTAAAKASSRRASSAGWPGSRRWPDQYSRASVPPGRSTRASSRAAGVGSSTTMPGQSVSAHHSQSKEASAKGNAARSP